MGAIETPLTAVQSVSVSEEIQRMGPWFHNLHLPDGTQTVPDHQLGDFPAFKWRELASHIPEDLTGWSALDIGCNAGFYTFELARRGASVVGIDSDPHYLGQAEWAAERFEMNGRARFRQMQVYDLARIDQSFDLVLFMGILYHLRYPMLALDTVARRVKRLLVIQTLMIPGEEVIEDTYDHGIHDREPMTQPGWPRMAFIEHMIYSDPTNWLVPNRAGMEAMLRSSGMRIVSRPETETWICEPDLDHPSCASTWNAREYLSATGQTPGGSR